MTISKKIASMITRSSWIRKMFEEGARLKAEYGADGIYDFSLGNPNLQPPEEFRKVLSDTVNASGAGDHAYMPNTGYPHVRKADAEYLS
jgi:aspartate aminotransferase